MKRGKLIVLDGTDGSGKSTQVELLRKRLLKEGYKVKVVDFPEYYSNFFGAFIGHCLKEQYYKFTNTHPKIASVLYAADRWESSEKVNKWLTSGHVVIANRYVSANQIHQGGKIKSTKKREAFMKWLHEMEYNTFKIPKPDKVFLLHVPMNVILKLIKERNKNSQRAYLGKKKDVVEADVNYLTNSNKSALWLAKHEKNWTKIDCAPGGEMESRENIHEEIYAQVKKIIKK